MEVFVKIERGRYVDSLETLLASSVLNEQPGIEIGCAGMATDPGKDVLESVGLLTEELKACDGSCYIIAARAESREAFDRAGAGGPEPGACPGRRYRAGGTPQHRPHQRGQRRYRWPHRRGGGLCGWRHPGRSENGGAERP